MARDDTYGLTVYEQDWDVLNDKLARTHGTKLISDEHQMMFRFEDGPAQDWIWKNERPEQRGRTYVVDTDVPGLSDDAELIQIEGDTALVAAEQGSWKTKTKAKRYRENASLAIFVVLALTLVWMGYDDFTRKSDLSGFIVGQQRAIERARESQRSEQSAQQVVIQAPGLDANAEGLQALPTPSTPQPTPTATPDPLGDAS